MNCDDCLFADIGGTHIRLEMSGADYAKRKIADFPTLSDAVSWYVACGPKPARGLFTVNGPVAHDGRSGRGTNTHWTFDSAELRRNNGIDVRFVNDFIAKASAVPHIGAGDKRLIGGGSPERGAPVGVIGPGTGLGVGYLAGGRPYASEGGHCTAAAVTEDERAAIAALGDTHVSMEDVTSGPGTAALYKALGGGIATPEEILARAKAGEPLALKVMDLRFAFLGTHAGNLALTFGAKGGMFIIGSVFKNAMDMLVASPFYERFCAKGRMRRYLGEIPVYVVTARRVAMTGLKHYAGEIAW